MVWVLLSRVLIWSFCGSYPLFLNLLVLVRSLPSLTPFSFLLCRPELQPAAARAADVHAVPDAGAGEGVQVQPLPDAPPPYRAVAHAVSDGAADQDLVPEPPHEGEEGAAGHQGAQRAGESQGETRRRWSRQPQQPPPPPPSAAAAAERRRRRGRERVRRSDCERC